MKIFTTHIPPFQPQSPPPPPPRHHVTVDRQIPMRLHNLHRVTTTAHLNPIQFHLKNTNHINFNPNSNFTFISTMSDSEAKKEIKSGEDSIGVKEAEKQPPEKLPEPPEKPLPGDCCGSGCVRCVWDVYYEELDEYNKIYKSETVGSKVS
uniref:uncharacterized protein LOC122588577 n=1 Tax=Erigeron canadensis TaxID=72917 RepID=UPI001CB8F46A|nr:uncharacterized protein LOC122588577 [Erigeron canadensis]